MIFRKKKKYPLPKFPDTVAPRFRELCEDVCEDEVKKFLPEVKKVLHKFLQLSGEHPRLDMDAAEMLCRVTQDVLKDYTQLPTEGRSLVIGAVRYFVQDTDGLSEIEFASGFHDDVRVMNHVLEEIGRDDLYIHY